MLLLVLYLVTALAMILVDTLFLRNIEILDRVSGVSFFRVHAQDIVMNPGFWMVVADVVGLLLLAYLMHRAVVERRAAAA